MSTDSKVGIEKFGRMQAKTAQAWATANLGKESSRPLLIGTIIRCEHDPFLHVGGSVEEPPLSEDLHQVELGRTRRLSRNLLLARTRLFARPGLPAC